MGYGHTYVAIHLKVASRPHRIISIFGGNHLDLRGLGSVFGSEGEHRTANHFLEGTNL